MLFWINHQRYLHHILFYTILSAFYFQLIDDKFVFILRICFYLPDMIGNDPRSSPISWDFCDKCLTSSGTFMAWLAMFNGCFYDPYKLLYIVIIFIESPETNNQILKNVTVWGFFGNSFSKSTRPWWLCFLRILSRN